ncbi:hypothetical protein RRG08_027124 [Elysia crispata]|uniref:Uncharacterized protein n=1 Tax=Elysia crispata TaxID=231223 RepID=A0AAE0YVF4_9GAST|nr:hypothetical protein RRG08_027124 [Elysia crispata]
MAQGVAQLIWIARIFPTPQTMFEDPEDASTVFTKRSRQTICMFRGHKEVSLRNATQMDSEKHVLMDRTWRHTSESAPRVGMSPREWSSYTTVGQGLLTAQLNRVFLQRSWTGSSYSTVGQDLLTVHLDKVFLHHSWTGSSHSIVGQCLLTAKLDRVLLQHSWTGSSYSSFGQILLTAQLDKGRLTAQLDRVFLQHSWTGSSYSTVGQGLLTTQLDRIF